MKTATFVIPDYVKPFISNPNLHSVDFQYQDPIQAMIGMLHFNPLAADWDNLCFTYEEGDEYDDFCNGDRVKRIQVLIVGCCTSVLLTLGVVVLGVGCAVLNRLAPRLRFSPD